MIKNWVKSKGNGFELAGEFELSEFKLPGFYCIHNKMGDCKSRKSFPYHPTYSKSYNMFYNIDRTLRML